MFLNEGSMEKVFFFFFITAGSIWSILPVKMYEKLFLGKSGDGKVRLRTEVGHE